jgi:hypothetical protein
MEESMDVRMTTNLALGPYKMKAAVYVEIGWCRKVDWNTYYRIISTCAKFSWDSQYCWKYERYKSPDI